MSRRKFTLNGCKSEIANSSNCHYKYDIYKLEKNNWIKIGGCNTLHQGYEKAVRYEYPDYQI